MPNKLLQEIMTKVDPSDSSDSIEQLLTKIEKNTRKRPEQTFEFKMDKNSQRFAVDPPISLHDGSYCLGLTSLTVYNTIFNVTPTNNFIRYYDSSKRKWFPVRIPPGAYEIEQISDYLNDMFPNLIIEGNESTQKSEITMKYYDKVDFTCECSIADLLGFKEIILEVEEISSEIGYEEDHSRRRPIVPGGGGGTHPVGIPDDIIPPGRSKRELDMEPLEPLVFDTLKFNRDQTYVSKGEVKIISIDKIHLNCDLVQGSILNGKPSSILFSFSIDVPPGYRMIKNPNTILYKNVTAEKIESIHFYFLDDDGKEVEFNGETITFTLQMIMK